MAGEKKRGAQAVPEAASSAAKADPQALNRMADLLARQGRREEAIAGYRRIADQFVEAGFLPKAAAILKKILRLDPQDREALFLLGRLYADQKLIGEARNYLQHAATLLLAQRDFARARQACEILIEAQPAEPLHRVRLAEVGEAAGDRDGAVENLLAAAAMFAAAGNRDEADRLRARAREMDPGNPRAALESARALAAAGRIEEAVALLSPLAEGAQAPPELTAELAGYLVSAGRPAQAEPFATAERARSWGVECWQRVFRASLQRGGAEQVWAWLDRAFPVHAADAAAAPIFAGLCAIDARIHAEALERFLARHERHARAQDLPEALAALASACVAAGLTEQATAIEARRASAAQAFERRVERRVGPRVEGRPTSRAARPVLPFEIDAPAVPLSRADEEFVAGRLTGAELVEDYDLLDTALEQIEEVTARFPGHVAAQERRVVLLRGGGVPPGELGDGLARLALALRASGRRDEARVAAEEALGVVELAPEARAALAAAGLCGAAGQPASAPPVPPPAAQSIPGSGTLIDPGVTPAPPPLRPVASAPAGPPAAARAGAQARRTRVPGSDIIAEVRALIDKGDGGEARRRIEALRVLGYDSPDLDALDKASRKPAARSHGAAGPVKSVEVTVGFDDGPEPAAVAPAAVTRPVDDLGTIAAALDGVLFEEAKVPLAPEADEECSIDEVVASFRSHVAEQVGEEDHRTHYDLGIAYKEMGLVTEAIDAFVLASRAAGLRAEACNMIALCHRERGEIDDAVRWYREALAGAGGQGLERGLRYDLAETLLERGDAEAALLEFRGLLRVDPGYRDVGLRVAGLEREATTT